MINKRACVWPQWPMRPETVAMVEKCATAANVPTEEWLDIAIRHQAAIDKRMRAGRESIRRINGSDVTEVEVEP
jgi:hypothetical protein